MMSVSFFRGSGDECKAAIVVRALSAEGELFFGAKIAKSCVPPATLRENLCH